MGAGFHAAVIGPAGERQVRYATISHDGRHAGRGGSGAVLGAKNLKAVVVGGTQLSNWADPAALAELARELSRQALGPATAKYRELGTAANLLAFNRLHALPTRNFQRGSFEGAARIAPESLVETRHKLRNYCAACTIGCEHMYEMRPGSDGAAGPVVRLEYENLFALGPLCGVEDADAVLAASRRCDQLGLDTISTGGTIALAMECVERGWLNAPWLRFGDGRALLQAIEQIGARRGLGRLLGEGSLRLARAVGHDALAVAPQVKGLELPGYEPRSLPMMALGLATGTRGADHNRSGAYEIDFSDRADRRHPEPEAAGLAAGTEDQAALFDSLILCKFLRGVFSDVPAEFARMLRAVTGWDVAPDELRQTARRIVSAKKLFNIRAGWTPQEDTLPERFLNQPLPDDPEAVLTAERLAALVRAYNLARGWRPDGQLEEEHLRQLQLDDL
jgi:aldehyde:ferredoxin oxidoreductase